MTFRLHPMGGLCNRLQAILSYRAVYGSLVVEWADESQTGGHFLDALEPLDGVTFVSGPALPVTHHGGPVVLGPDYVADNVPHTHAPAGWVVAYRELRLCGGMGSADLLSGADYAAVHVRRTDHVQLAAAFGRVTPIEDFYRFIDAEMGPVYIATDNATTQRVLCERARFPEFYAPITDRENPNEHDQRNTTIQHAAVDLFACVGAARFMGTQLSSFTATIELMRRLR